MKSRKSFLLICTGEMVQAEECALNSMIVSEMARVCFPPQLSSQQYTSYFKLVIR